MADVAVTTSTASTVHTLQQRSGPIYTSKSCGYQFYMNSSSRVFFKSTTDGGATWSPAFGTSLTGSSGNHFDIYCEKWTPGDTGPLIHVVWMNTSNRDVEYRSLDTSDDSLGTTVAVALDVAFGIGRSSANISTTKAVGGNLYTQFWGDGAGGRGFSRSTDNGSNWTARTDGADGDEADEILLFPDPDSADTNDIAMIYWDRSADEITLKKYDDSANTWSETVVSSGMVDSDSILQMSAVLRLSDGHVILAAWNGFDVSTADLKVFDIAVGTTTVITKTDVITNADDCVAVGLFIDQNTDDLYCAYLGNEDGSETFGTSLTAFYKKSTDGGDTWGSQTTYQEDVADDEKYISAGSSTPGALDGLFQPSFFNDDLNDVFVNVNNSVALSMSAAARRVIVVT